MEKQLNPLTEREEEVLKLIAAGKSNANIANTLGISQNTVAWHIRQIFSKLDVKRRTQAVAVAQSLDLLEASTTPPSINQIPLPLTPIIGRKAEITHIVNLLGQPETRLLTILGPGGIGKTRLALAVAHAVGKPYTSAVYFVTLEGIRSPEHVIPTLAEAVGLQFRGHLEPRLQLFNFLEKQALLLILDSCEHLLEAVPLFSEMLARCLNLKILATSRERLNQRGETIIWLHGLPYSGDSQHGDSADAVNLFVQNAQRLNQSFKPDKGEMQLILSICQSVEGMPLAIELAAWWVNQLSPAQIYSEIANNTAILQTSARDMPERHRSIEAVFAHSWNLLTDGEQTAFKNLSVFQSEFDYAAAEKVAGASLITLKSLVNKCLIYPTGRGRYRIHALLRQFGADKLVASPEAHQGMQIRYARYYLNYLYQRRIDLEGRNSPDVIQELRQDMDNIWAAWRIGGEQCLAMEISQASRDFAILHTSAGLVTNLVAEIEYIMPFLQAQQHLPDVNLALAEILMMLSPAYIRYYPEKNVSLLKEAEVYLDRLEKPPDSTVALLYTHRAVNLMAMKQPEKAANELQMAVTLCAHIKDHSVVAWVALTFAAGLVELNYYQQAHDALQFTQKRIGNFGAFFFHSYMLSVLALIHTGLGHYSDAQRILVETIDENRRYAHVVPFDLFLLAAATYLHRMGFLEAAYEMICLYFQPGFPNVLLSNKAKVLHEQLEKQLPLEKREAIAERAEIWLSENPTLRNPLGIRADFFDYLTRIVNQTVHE